MLSPGSADRFSEGGDLELLNRVRNVGLATLVLYCNPELVRVMVQMGKGSLDRSVIAVVLSQIPQGLNSSFLWVEEQVSLLKSCDHNIRKSSDLHI